MLYLLRILAVSALWWAVQASAGGPQLQVDQAEVDFGQLLQGSQVEHVYTLRNNGDQLLVIEQVRSSCGCTAALLSAAEIPPGQGGEVRATFDAGRFRGAVHKTITLTTNEPQRPTATLHLRARVVPVIEAQPENIPLGGKRRQAEVVLFNRSQEAIALTGAYATNPALKVQLGSRVIPAGGSARMTVRLAGGGAPGGYVIVQTGSERLPELRLSVYSVP